eukprot:TRINITY_DN29989_c0_g1_i1.p1 TRINITY_DN29989_c0_g1~~TRINITY_DN29989_c0_g1_i1.p1  ORF type:complete len:409 (+),score=127.74 TRINITY_DN29989_c0_g1_i1:42-1268(+)
MGMLATLVGVAMGWLLAPLWVPLFLARWAYLVLRCAQGRVDFAIKIVGASFEEVWFLVTHLPSGLQMLWAHRAVQGVVYTHYKDTELVMDIYNDRPGQPVVVFVYGGAWCSGARWMYTLTAARLAEELQATVVVPDYLFYPHASMVEMAEQLGRADRYVRAAFPSAPEVWWCGHSAGAHLIMLYHLRLFIDAPHRSGSNSVESAAAAAGRAGSRRSVSPAAPQMATKLHHVDELEAVSLWPTPYRMLGGGGAEPGTSPPPHEVPFKRTHAPPAGLILLSGVYDIRQHLEYETARGVHLLSGMKNATFGYYEANSPACILEQLRDAHSDDELRRLFAAFPKTLVVHGSQDLTVSHGHAHSLHWLLSAVGIESELHHRLRLTHVGMVTHIHNAAASPLLPVVKRFMGVGA